MVVVGLKRGPEDCGRTWKGAGCKETRWRTGYGGKGCVGAVCAGAGLRRGQDCAGAGLRAVRAVPAPPGHLGGSAKAWQVRAMKAWHGGNQLRRLCEAGAVASCGCCVLCGVGL